jgi:hypothetical protein
MNFRVSLMCGQCESCRAATLPTHTSDDATFWALALATVIAGFHPQRVRIPMPVTRAARGAASTGAGE